MLQFPQISTTVYNSRPALEGSATVATVSEAPSLPCLDTSMSALLRPADLAAESIDETYQAHRPLLRVVIPETIFRGRIVKDGAVDVDLKDVSLTIVCTSTSRALNPWKGGNAKRVEVPLKLELEAESGDFRIDIAEQELKHVASPVFGLIPHPFLSPNGMRAELTFHFADTNARQKLLLGGAPTLTPECRLTFYLDPGDISASLEQLSGMAVGATYRRDERLRRPADGSWTPWRLKNMAEDENGRWHVFGYGDIYRGHKTESYGHAVKGTMHAPAIEQ